MTAGSLCRHLKIVDRVATALLAYQPGLCELQHYHLIGEMRTVEIACIDVVHARCDSLAKNRDRAGNITWRAQTLFVAILSGELHGPIWEVSDLVALLEASERQLERAA